MAEGVPRPTAALVVLSLRLLATGATVVLSMIAVILARSPLISQPADKQEVAG
jgi:hypothetical protein